jgi:hypothetical protein
VVPLDATLVRGSHGRVPEDAGDHPVIIVGEGGGESSSGGVLPESAEARDVYSFLLGAVAGRPV